MAQADPKNTDGSTTIQELVEALWRYIENSDATEKPPRVAALNERKRTGEGVRGIAKRFGVDPSTVQRISRPFVDVAA